MRHEDDTLLTIYSTDLESLYDDLHAAKDVAIGWQRMYESCRTNLIAAMILDAIAAIALVVMIMWQQ